MSCAASAEECAALAGGAGASATLRDLAERVRQDYPRRVEDILRRARGATLRGVLAFIVSQIARTACVASLGAAASAASTSVLSTQLVATMQGAFVGKGATVALERFTSLLESRLSGAILATVRTVMAHTAKSGGWRGVLEALHGVGAEVAAGLRAIGPRALGSIAGRLQKLNAEGVPVALSSVDLCQIVLTTCVTLALSYASELTSEMAEFLMQAATTYSSPPPPSPHSRRAP